LGSEPTSASLSAFCTHPHPRPFPPRGGRGISRRSVADFARLNPTFSTPYLFLAASNQRRPLMAYLCDMAEKSGGAERSLTQLTVELTKRLAEEVERLPDPDSEDCSAAERLRMIHLAAKAGKEIAAMTLAAERAVRTIQALRDANPADDAEDNEEMNDAEPKDIEQVYAELQSRLDRLTAALERKRAAEFCERAGGEVELGRESG
jgi:hypothetical protein